MIEIEFYDLMRSYKLDMLTRFNTRIITQERGRNIMEQSYTFGVKTDQPVAMIDITKEVQKVVKESGVKQGTCVIFIPHTTAGITINENADPDVVRDFTMEINKIVPFADGYNHGEGNSAAHIKASLMGYSETVIIENGRLLLGTWQGIYFMEFDGPRIRKVNIKVMEG